MQTKIAATLTAATVAASPLAVQSAAFGAPAPATAGISASPVHTSVQSSSRSYAKRIARKQVRQRGWSKRQYRCVVKLWQRESGWNVHADNPSSSAYGIPQALPGRKMRSAGSDWRNNPSTQIRWGLRYIKSRYGSPCSALAHSNRHNWY